jgi:hypothetical protein
MVINSNLLLKYIEIKINKTDIIGRMYFRLYKWDIKNGKINEIKHACIPNNSKSKFIYVLTMSSYLLKIVY